MAYSDLIREIKKDEGFRAKPYKNILGFWTVGYGTKLPLNHDEKELVKDETNITEFEADSLLKSRLEKAIAELNSIKGLLVNSLSESRREVIYNMCYQLGFNGILGFKKMWQTIETGNYAHASDEMKDSKWYYQTPLRAKKLIDKMIKG
jgi:lysozyme